jgi:hypothetical protein
MFSLQSLLPAFLPLLRKNLPKIEPYIIEYLKKYPPLSGEKGVTVMLDVDGDKAFMAVVGIDAENRVVRLIARERVGKFIEHLMGTVGSGSGQ